MNQPGPLTESAVDVATGGRVDLGFVVPKGGVRVDLGGTTAMVFGSDPTTVQPQKPDEELDLLTYGEPADLGFDPTQPDRRFDYRIGRRPGFLDGRPGLFWTVNGKMFPDVPMYMVCQGDVAVFTIGSPG